MRKTTPLFATIVALGIAGSAVAQQSSTPAPAPIKRTPLQTFDVPGTNYQTVIGLAEVIPNVNIGRHTHPGPESGYILEGELTVLVQGQPEKLVKTGESYQVPPNAVHDARSGAQGTKVLATYVVEKGKPLTSPAD